MVWLRGFPGSELLASGLLVAAYLNTGMQRFRLMA